MNILTSVLFPFLVFLAVEAGEPIECPNAEDLSPCECICMAYGLHIKCINFDDNSFLIGAFKALRGYKVQNVLLHGLKLTEVLPSDLFNGLEITELRVERSELKFSQPAFTGLNGSLQVLNVAQHSMIKSSEDFSLAELNKLTELNIKVNPLGIVRDQWLNGKIPNVRKIALDENDIKEIESNAFAQFPHLQRISLAENRIQVVKRSMFPKPATALNKIDLSGNQIQQLPSDFFIDMPKLTKVILSGNDLLTLEESVWTSVWLQLNKVLLFENNLVCDNDLSWMKKLRWPKQVDGNCVAPSSLAGKSLKDVYRP